VSAGQSCTCAGLTRATVAFEQFELDAETAALTKSDFYRGPVSRAVVSAVLCALERLLAACPTLPLPVELPTSLTDAARTACVSRGLPFQGGATHERPLLKASARDFSGLASGSTLSAAALVQRINSADSQPGVQTALLGGQSLFIYGAHVQTAPLCPSAAARAEHSHRGKVLATRSGAVLVDCGAEHPIWLTHLRRPKAKTDTYLHAKLPALQCIESISGLAERLELAHVEEWAAPRDEADWQRAEGTYQQVWVELEQVDESTVAYVHFDFYNGACATEQCRELEAALQWALVQRISAVVLLGGPGYFSNGIALNVIEGSADPAAESWANINAIDDVMQRILAPHNVLTIAALRGNAAAGGLALATAADVVLCSASATLNPHYRGVGLFGSEYHTFSWTARCGAQKARELARNMMPMSPTQALECGMVDHIVGTGAEGPAALLALIKQDVARLVLATVGDAATDATGLLSCGARWTKPFAPAALGFDSSVPAATPIMQQMLDAKHAYLSLLFASRAGRSGTPLSFAAGFAAFRTAELEQMRLDMFHPVRSQRYHSRRLAFVRKLVPASTPTRFALHRRFGADWAAPLHAEAALDLEETDAFDSLGDVPDSAAVTRMPPYKPQAFDGMSRSESGATMSTMQSLVSALADTATPASTAPPSPQQQPRKSRMSVVSTDLLEERELEDQATQLARAAPGLGLVAGTESPARRGSGPSISFGETAVSPSPARASVASAASPSRGTVRRTGSATSFGLTLRRAVTPSSSEAGPSPTKASGAGRLSRIFTSIGRSSGSGNKNRQSLHAHQMPALVVAAPPLPRQEATLPELEEKAPPTPTKDSAPAPQPVSLYPCYYESDDVTACAARTAAPAAVAA
jgi:enoyl-CoA hydratase/carnithine racemase